MGVFKRGESLFQARQLTAATFDEIVTWIDSGGTKLSVPDDHKKFVEVINGGHAKIGDYIVRETPQIFTVVPHAQFGKDYKEVDIDTSATHAPAEMPKPAKPVETKVKGRGGRKGRKSVEPAPPAIIHHLPNPPASETPPHLAPEEPHKSSHGKKNE